MNRIRPRYVVLADQLLLGLGGGTALASYVRLHSVAFGGAHLSRRASARDTGSALRPAHLLRDARRSLLYCARSQSAMRWPISSPASSWRKCEAFSILIGGSAPIRFAKRLPDLEREHGVRVGPQHEHRPLVAPEGPPGALLPSAPPGISGEVGRISGKARAPAFDSVVGNGRVVGGDHVLVHAAGARRSSPASRSAGPRCARRSRGSVHQASDICCSPVKRPVSMTTIRAMRSGCSAASRSPIGPPQSWTTDGGVPQVEVLEQRAADLRDVAVVRVPVEVDGLVRAPEPRVVGRDAAVARRRGPAGSPCARGTTRSARRGRTRPAGPSPSSTWARRSPSTSR